MAKKFEVCPKCEGGGVEKLYQEPEDRWDEDEIFLEIQCNECNGEKVVRVREAWEIDMDREQASEMAFCYGPNWREM